LKEIDERQIGRPRIGDGDFCGFGHIKEKFGFAELSGEQLRTRQLDERKGLGDEEESSDEEA